MTPNTDSFCFLTQHTLVILSSSKDGVLIQDDLRRIPQHFDWLSVTKEIVGMVSNRLRKYNSIYISFLLQLTPVILSSSKDRIPYKTTYEEFLDTSTSSV